LAVTALRAYMPSVKSVELLRSNGYKGHITFGSEFSTLCDKEIMNHCLEIDSIIRGEGEFTIV
jgi:hypothetical protein